MMIINHVQAQSLDERCRTMSLSQNRTIYDKRFPIDNLLASMTNVIYLGVCKDIRS